MPNGATVAAASATTGIADEAVSVSQTVKGNWTPRTAAATRNTMPITRIARGPVLATPLCRVAITPWETVLNANGSAMVCPAGAGSSEENTPNLIQVKT